MCGGGCFYGKLLQAQSGEEMSRYVIEAIDKYVGLFINHNSRDPNALILDRATNRDLCAVLSLMDRKEITSLRSFTSLGRRLDVFVVDDNNVVIVPCLI